MYILNYAKKIIKVYNTKIYRLVQIYIYYYFFQIESPCIIYLCINFVNYMSVDISIHV